MQKIEIFFSSEQDPDFVTGAILYGTGANCSHTGFIVDDDRIFHQTGIGFHEMSVSKFLEKGKIFVDRFDVTPLLKVDPLVAYGYLLGRLETPYSEAQYIGFAAEILKLPSWMVSKIKSLFRDGAGETVCSEEGALFLKNICGLNPGDTDYISPVALRSFLRPIIQN